MKMKALIRGQASLKIGILQLSWQYLIFYHLKKGSSKWYYNHNEHIMMYRSKVMDKYKGSLIWSKWPLNYYGTHILSLS